ncbi:sensor histidine kinase [bacterium D16-51]|nr:sensor histidine kinase [bacterium D16-59]RKI56309.1 sensor histidine kinase [bacterium D16-51]
MEKIRNLSLRKTFVLYMAVSLVSSFLVSAFIVRAAAGVQEQIWWKYVDEDIYYGMEEWEVMEFVVNASRPEEDEMKRADYILSEVCDFLETYTVLVLSIAGSCAAVFLFYRNKLKRPLAELGQASQNIANNNLDFQVCYENRDEMGRLCQEFEKMRGQLAENNRELWRMIEDEKALRAAIAHDIRSPLAVLRGYQEMLAEYLPNQEIDTDRALDMVSESLKQIGRIDVFTETMRKMSSLEKRDFIAEEISAGQLKADIQAELEILEKRPGKKIVLKMPITEEVFCGDKEIILEVLENLLANSLRYAKEQVEVYVEVSASELKICVRDDGAGFQESGEKITKAFYRKNVKDSLEHAGMGMYLSRLYCEKHRGKLIIENSGQAGAVVTAVFRRIV